MIKPMLAVSAPSFDQIKYPVLATPKLDGFRCLVVDRKAVTRSLKPFPNLFIRQRVEELVSNLAMPNLDGEIILPGKSFRDVSSECRRAGGTPDFHYMVFDVRSERPYNDRVLEDLYNMWLPLWCEKLIPRIIWTPEELKMYEESQLRLGFEGVIVRSPNGPYKHGRSTLKEGYMLKIKRFTDSEGFIIGYTQMFKNLNAPFIGELGQTKRTSHQENKVPLPMMGALLIKDINTGMECELGTGFTEDERAYLWRVRDELVRAKELVKYKFQEYGTVERQRSGVYLGLRAKEDL